MQVHSRPGVSIKDLLRKALAKRDLSINACVVYVAQMDRKMPLDWNIDSSFLQGHEVCVHSCVILRLHAFVSDVFRRRLSGMRSHATRESHNC